MYVNVQRNYIHCILEGHNTQYSGHTGQTFQADKTIEMQLVRPTEVCSKVEGEKHG